MDGRRVSCRWIYGAKSLKFNKELLFDFHATRTIQEESGGSSPIREYSYTYTYFVK